MDNKSIECDGKTIEVDDKYSCSDYNNKLDLLNHIISNGLNKLLTEASQRNYLDPPYGLVLHSITFLFACLLFYIQQVAHHCQLH